MARRVSCDVNEEARDDARSVMGTEVYLRSTRERKKIETRFGDVDPMIAEGMLEQLRRKGVGSQSVWKTQDCDE